MSYPDDLLFYAKYNSTLNADFSVGNVVADSSNNVSIDTVAPKLGAGCLKARQTTYSLRYSGGASFTTKGTISFFFRTNNILSDYRMVDIWNTTNQNNRIRFQYLNWSGSNRRVYCYIYNSAGDFLSAFKQFSGVVDTWYHIELGFDLNIGATRVFVDGAAGAINSTIFTRNALTNYLYVVHDTFYAGANIFFIDDIRIFNTVQHTSDFTPPVSEFPSFTTAYNTFGYPFGFPSKRGFAR